MKGLVEGDGAERGNKNIQVASHHHAPWSVLLNETEEDNMHDHLKILATPTTVSTGLVIDSLSQ